jgi:hypothetical protein
VSHGILAISPYNGEEVMIMDKRFIRDMSPQINVPNDCESLEADYQRTLYVEDRIARIASLKHDKMQLKDRFLQFLVPPDVRDGFSSEINRLSCDNTIFRDQIAHLTSEVARLQQEQIIVVIERDKANDITSSREETVIHSKVRHHGPYFVEKLVISIFILIVLLISALRVLQYSSSSVDSDPVGVEHSINGGTTNGQLDQPSKGPITSGKGNRRLP